MDLSTAHEKLNHFLQQLRKGQEGPIADNHCEQLVIFLVYNRALQSNWNSIWEEGTETV